MTTNKEGHKLVRPKPYYEIKYMSSDYAGGARRVLVRQVKAKRPEVQAYFRVNRDGADWEKDTGKFLQSELILITEASLISKRELWMNLHYAELEIFEA